jgi:2-polyprenyl-3-methyl-5-hydroxy-6-metoxy-1,4-benzoquinol methylase
MVRRQTASVDGAVKARTADSFAYEWKHFGGLREEWEQNFKGYLQPLSEDWFAGKRVLDVGTGSGRHSHRAAMLGAEVVACDLGDAIDVARLNLPDSVLTIQADAEDLPLAEGSFDLVMAIGVLHHLPDTGRALRRIVRHARPGGRVHVYLYWVPKVRWHRWALRLVTRLTRILHQGERPGFRRGAVSSG